MLARDFSPEARLAQHLKDVRLILELGDGPDRACLCPRRIKRCLQRQWTAVSAPRTILP